LEFESGASDLIDQSHWSRWSDKEVDPLIQSLHLVCGGLLFHGEVVEAQVLQALESHSLQAGQIEVRMQAKAEWHRGIASIFDDRGDL